LRQAKFARRAFISQQEKTHGGKAMYESSAPVDEMNDHRHGGSERTE
jgi:hypothetical protein